MREGDEGWADAPIMEDDDTAAWNFYMQTATPFVKEFGLMNDLVREMGVEGVANKTIFLGKLSAIHNAVMEWATREAAKDAGKEKPDFMAEGSDNG